MAHIKKSFLKMKRDHNICLILNFSNLKYFSKLSVLVFPVVQTVKNLSAVQETRVWSLGREDPLEKGMATHPSILAWRLPWTEEPGGCSPSGRRESDRTERLTLLLPIYLMDVGSATPSVHSVLISKLLLPLVVPLGESIGFLVVPPA